MIKVYQIQLTDAEVAELNSKGWGGLEADTRLAAYRDRGLKFKSKYFQFYDHVANVYTDDMEEAFALMNLWNDENKVETFYDRSCSSMSVGDILETEDGQRYRCSSFGFTTI